MEEKTALRTAFVGDSILHGWGVARDAACWRVFAEITGLEVVSRSGENPMALPGATLTDLVARTPGLVARHRPDLVFVSAGANHYDGDGVLAWPYGMTEEALMKLFFRLFSDLRHAGCRSVWLGFPPFEACGREQEIPLRLSGRIFEVCRSVLYDARFFLEDMLEDPSWDARGGRFYDNLAMDVHPNAAGQERIARTCADWFAELGKNPDGFSNQKDARSFAE